MILKGTKRTFFAEFLLPAGHKIKKLMAGTVHYLTQLSSKSRSTSNRCYAQIVHFELLLLICRCEDPRDR